MKKIFSYQYWFLFSFLFLSILGLITFPKSLHGDERHIIETIRLFANNFSFETLKNYPEVTPPFFFIFYALWAKLFDQSVESLRLLTLLISFVTWQLLYWLILYFTKNHKHSFLLSFLVVINPYFFGTSVYVFTDMLTIMLFLTGLIAFLKNQTILFTIITALAILSRQYVVILPISVVVYSILTIRNNRMNSIKFFIASTISCIPIIVFFLIWKNIAPQSGIDKWIIPNSSFYNVDYINTYITFAIIYSLPIIITYFYKIKLNYQTVLIALIVAVILSLFPVKPSAATLVFTEHSTVGYAHNLFSQIFGTLSLSVKIILGILLFAGVYINVEIIKHTIINVEKVLNEKKIILTLLWFLFLLMMPLSYQVWEKYLTMILPFLILCIYFLLNNSKLNTKSKLKFNLNLKRNS